MIKKTRSDLQKEYTQKLQKIKNRYNVQPSITLEYLYMKQDNEKEALEMLTLEVQRSLLYNNSLAYSDYTGQVNHTIQQVLEELEN